MGRVIPMDDASMLAMFAYQLQTRHTDVGYGRVVNNISDPEMKLCASALRDKMLGEDLAKYDAGTISWVDYYWDWAQKRVKDAREAGEARDARRRSSL